MTVYYVLVGPNILISILF